MRFRSLADGSIGSVRPQLPVAMTKAYGLMANSNAVGISTVRSAGPGPLRMHCHKGVVCEVAHTGTKQHPCKLTIQVTEVIWGDNWQPTMGSSSVIFATRGDLSAP